MVVHGIANERFTLSNSCLARENHHTYIHRSCIPTDWLKSMLPIDWTSVWAGLLQAFELFHHVFLLKREHKQAKVCKELGQLQYDFIPLLKGPNICKSAWSLRTFASNRSGEICWSLRSQGHDSVAALLFSSGSMVLCSNKRSWNAWNLLTRLISRPELVRPYGSCRILWHFLDDDHQRCPSSDKLSDRFLVTLRVFRPFGFSIVRSWHSTEDRPWGQVQFALFYAVRMPPLSSQVLRRSVLCSAENLRTMNLQNQHSFIRSKL